VRDRHFIRGKEVDPREWRDYSSSQRAKDDLTKTIKQNEKPIEIRTGDKK